MKRNHTKPSRLSVFGDSMLNKLPGLSRKRRKREATKKCRVQLRKEMKHDA